MNFGLIRCNLKEDIWKVFFYQTGNIKNTLTDEINLGKSLNFFSLPLTVFVK